jgi:septum formation protein
MKLILGSKSPRRKDLLKAIGFDFEIRTKETDESFPSNLAVTEVAQFVANIKANDLLSDLHDNEVLICADTTVLLNEKILGKPSSPEEAKSMLNSLSGKTHKVITGVTICSSQKRVEFSVSTDVTFKVLSEAEIDYYIHTYKPFDKAGAYGIQEWIGYIGIERINGSYNNVVGLPTHELYLALNEFA